MTPPLAAKDAPSASADFVAVVGPTASGKTRLAVGLARQFGGEIVSFDSRQVYRGLDLGSGKDLDEYRGPPGTLPVPYHLIDLVAPDEEFDLFRFLEHAREAIRDIRRRGCLPIGVGGSALHIKALLDNYRLEGAGVAPELRRDLESRTDDELLCLLAAEAPDLHARVDRTQRRRIVRALEIARTRGAGRETDVADSLALRPLLLGPYFTRPELHARIEARLDARLAAGLVAEVARLHAAGLAWERLEFFGLESRYVSRHLTGALSLSDMRSQLLARIRQFCRRQEIWLRKLEREGKVIHWIPRGDLAEAVAVVQAFLENRPLSPPRLRLSAIHYGPRSDAGGSPRAAGRKKRNGHEKRASPTSG